MVFEVFNLTHIANLFILRRAWTNLILVSSSFMNQSIAHPKSPKSPIFTYPNLFPQVDLEGCSKKWFDRELMRNVDPKR